MRTLKFLFCIFFTLCCTLVSAQIVMDAAGNAIFGKGNNTGTENLTINNGISIIDLNTSSNPKPFYITRSSNGKVITFARNMGGNGLRISQDERITLGFDPNYGDLSRCAPLTIFGYYHRYIMDLYQDGIMDGGIRMWYTGETYGESLYEANYNGNLVYSVYRTGNVETIGRMKASSFLQSSDLSLKSNIESIVSPLEKVMQLRGVVYDMCSPLEKKMKLPLSEPTYEIAKKYSRDLTPDVFKQIQEEKSRKRMGIIAQEVEKVVPEVVRTQEDGLKAVAYSELVGLLIEAMKEQQQMIDELKLEVASMKTGKTVDLRSTTETSGTTGSSSVLLENCSLSQNIPNPFTDETEIRYYVASGATNAMITIFDMQGKLLESYPAQTGQNSVVIEGSKLQPGMYLYSLIVDGQIMDTKKMLLTK